MMIRRIDFAMFAATWDIEDKKKIYFPETPKTPQQVTDEDLRALIFFAWKLKPEQIVIDDKLAHYIRNMAKYLSDKFGGSDDLPIVYSEDFRKTMARMIGGHGHHRSCHDGGFLPGDRQSVATWQMLVS